MLLKQPLAVNAGQVVRGKVSMKVNDQRSYDITASFIALDEEESRIVGASDERLRALMESQKSRCREALWFLHEQTYNYSYVGGGEGLDGVGAAGMKPENSGLYLPVESLLAESMNPPAAAASRSQQGTDFIVMTGRSTNTEEADPNAMQY
ncbi:hypothetical protein IWW38_003120 [Coemansia aciculifera]|uniref:Uncharacterized protein n=1 Tax=Coemansia aciculifera TaxID=417176 RepID=A0ACC1M2L2_9FUNG|nr:hypothetical protein IWW38_003120 [Coemansia aciculifera]